MYTLYRSPAGHRHDHTSSYYRHPKKFSVLTPDGSWFLTLEFPPTKAGFPLKGSQGKLLEDQEKSGKLDIFWKKSGKSKGRKFLSMQIFNF